MKSRSRIIPTFRYRDTTRAVDWLCAAFGFRHHLVVRDAKGDVAHAELTFDNGMIMIGPVRDDAFGQWQSTASDLGGNSQSAYVIVDDVDAHHEKAVAAGAKIVMPLKAEDYGGKGYSCLDCEGVLWNFGSYEPWPAVD